MQGEKLLEDKLHKNINKNYEKNLKVFSVCSCEVYIKK